MRTRAPGAGPACIDDDLVRTGRRAPGGERGGVSAALAQPWPCSGSAIKRAPCASQAPTGKVTSPTARAHARDAVARRRIDARGVAVRGGHVGRRTASVAAKRPGPGGLERAGHQQTGAIGERHREPDRDERPRERAARARSV